MATNYPGAIDNYTNPSSSEPMNAPSHAGQHANANDAVEAIETELGTNPSGSETNVVTRLAKIEDGTRLASNSITATQIAANAVGSSELADNAVDTNAIADSAVTSAKIADGTITSTDVAGDTFAAFGTQGNLLTPNQASGTDTLGTTAGFTVLGPHTLASSTSSPINGTRSLTCTMSGMGAGGLVVGSTANATGPATISVVGGQIYTVKATIKATEAAQCNIQIYWFQADGTTAASAASSPNYLITSSATATEYTITATAPSDAAKASFYFRRSSGADGAVWTFDLLSFHKGADGTFAMPGTPITGQSHIATNGAYVTSGAVAPEGVITAPPLSRYQQTSGAMTVTGAMEWVKASGTGATGWVAGADADTGWRDVTASLINGWSATGKLIMRRIGNTVTLTGYYPGLTASSKSSDTFYNPPAGFQTSWKAFGDYGLVGVALNNANGTMAPILRASDAGLLMATISTAWIIVSLVCTWTTGDAWPTSLPGTAA